MRLDPERHELRAIAEPVAGEPRRVTAAMASPVAARTGALAVVNASYFDEQGQPLGLLVVDGTRWRAANEEGWAWAAVAGGRLHLRTARSPVPAAVTQAVQAGPLLVVDGKPAALSSPRAARRSFLGADGAGRIVLGATNGPVTLRALAEWLAKPEADGGGGLAQALNLDGGGSSQLHVSELEPPLKVAGVPVPVFLGAFPRR